MRTANLREWVGRDDNAKIPPRVMLRVFQRTNGNCAKCTRALLPGHWACDHIVALVNRGKHAESNLQALCVSPCHSQKTKSDVAEKSAVYHKAAKHVGISLRKGPKMQSRGFDRRPAQRTASRPLERRT